jgi:hypothetical protein
MVNLKLNEIINSLNNKSFDELETELCNNIGDIHLIKDNGLLLVANNYEKDINKMSELEKECRSIILDENLNIICYTFNSIYYNDDAKQYLLNNNNNDYKIYECYEGTILTVYYHNDQWNVSTRRCLDAKKSIFFSNKSYFELMNETLNDTYNMNFKMFVSKLNKDNYYMFVLVNHENKNIVDYTKEFGENYKRLFHIMTRDRNTHNEIDEVIDMIDTPKEYKDFAEYDKLNQDKTEIVLPLEREGFIVKITDNDSNQCNMLKFQTNKYKKIRDISPNTNNKYQALIELYKNGKLIEYMKFFPQNSKITFEDEVYDSLGVIDATLKVLTSEFFELFKLLWNISTGENRNKELYDKLPKIHKKILYQIRGIYFRNKSKYIETMKLQKYDKQSYQGDKYRIIKISDIYDLLKKICNSKDIIKLIMARHEINQQYNTQFNNLSNKCDKISLKMITILTNKLLDER